VLISEDKERYVSDEASYTFGLFFKWIDEKKDLRIKTALKSK